MERYIAPNRRGDDFRPTRYALRSARAVSSALGRPKVTEAVVNRLENRLSRLRSTR